MSDLDELRGDLEEMKLYPGSCSLACRRRVWRTLERVLDLRDEGPGNFRSFGKDDDAFRAGWAAAIKALDRALRGEGE